MTRKRSERKIIHLEEEILHTEREILHELREENHHPHHPNRILSGVMAQIEGDPMTDDFGTTASEVPGTPASNLLPIAPGNSPQFQVTPTWAETPADGITPLVANTVWTASGLTGVTVTPNANDATGLTATVVIPKDAITPFTFAVMWQYTNLDGSTATASLSLSDTNGPSPIPNITSGTMTQIA